MRRLIGRSVTIVLGTCLAASAVALPPALAAPADSESGQTAGWAKLWHRSFKPRMGAHTTFEGVQRVGDRFAIVGGDDRGAVVWWSDDGLEWKRTPSTDATDHGVGVSIAGGPDGYVMAGYQRSPTPRGRIWRSADGREWLPADTTLPRDADTSVVAALPDGTFVAYGYSPRHDGCWMGSSADGGATWDLRWRGEWEPVYTEGCIGSLAQDADGLLAIIGGGISESADGVTWRELVPAKEIRAARPKGTRRWIDVGLVPLADGRVILGGKGVRTLVWSREGGLERIDGPVDWSGLRITGMLRTTGMATGPERAVAVKRVMPAPLVSPPADVHTMPWKTHGPVCRPFQPKLEHLATMLPSERLTCHARRELTFEAWIPPMEYGGICEFGAPHSWMICEDYWLATGPGPSPGLVQYALAPDAKVDKGAQRWGKHVRVTGHFDDPAAVGCPEPGWDGRLPAGWRPMTRSDFVEECRQRFVVTKMRTIKD